MSRAVDAMSAPRSPRAGRRAVLTALIVAVLAYALDQLTKYAVESTMQLGDSVAVIPGVLRWHYILNPGAAFSIGTGPMLTPPRMRMSLIRPVIVMYPVTSMTA